MPLIEVLTRTYKRPKMLAVNQASLARQTYQSYTQTLLNDPVGRGVGWSHRNLASYAPFLVGDYIWVLDDDDECIRPIFFEELRGILEERTPDVIFVKMDHGERGILPLKCWGCEPFAGGIGSAASIVKREIWQRHADAWGDHYAGDFDFIKAIWDSQASVYWFDVIASRVQRISLGAPE